MLIEPSIMNSVNKLSMLRVNRLCWNPEIVFNPITPFGQLDPNFSRRWMTVPDCSYMNRHCYTLVYYNQSKPEMNDFALLPD